MSRTLDLWVDLRSPYSYVAKEQAYELEKELGATVRFRPFALNLANIANLSNPAALQNGLRKVKYLYADVRRFAGPRGLTILGPKRIFDQKLIHLAWMLAEKSGHGRALMDLAYPRFFKRELDYEDRAAVDALLREVGVDPSELDAYQAEGEALLARHQQEAEAAGVFAVPTFVIDGELFWGQDRIDFVRAKLAA
jgi:2-hydroxychromene-2-carboxylate isomerase